MTDRDNRISRILQFMIGTMLALAGAASSWSAYQSALWGSTEAAYYSEAASFRLQSGLADAKAGQQQMVDVSMFMQWLDAYANENTELEEFYRQRFNPRFVPAFDAWIASKPRTNPKALRSPFSHPEYKVALRDTAADLEQEANKKFSAGLEAGNNSDAFVATTAIFGLVMFFAGMSQQFHRHSLQEILLAVACIMAGIGIFNLAALPIGS